MELRINRVRINRSRPVVYLYLKNYVSSNVERVNLPVGNTTCMVDSFPQIIVLFV